MTLAEFIQAQTMRQQRDNEIVEEMELQDLETRTGG